MTLHEILLSLAVSLGLGLLVGLQREHVANLVDAALEAFEPQRLSGEQVEITRDVPEGLPDVAIDLAAMSEASRPSSSPKSHMCAAS